MTPSQKTNNSVAKPTGLCWLFTTSQRRENAPASNSGKLQAEKLKPEDAGSGESCHGLGKKYVPESVM
jgi:hypothetical protein